MNICVRLIISLLLWRLAGACISRNHLGNEKIRTPKPQNGIPPCLIPPIENLVYQKEAVVDGRPGIRTGCFVQRGPTGTIIPPLQILPSNDAIPLSYYIIDATGNRKFIPVNGTVRLLLEDTSGGMIESEFSFHRICFPMECYSTTSTYARSCFAPIEGSCNSHRQCKESRQPKHLGSLLTVTEETWIHCRDNNYRSMVPIMTPEKPFGELHRLKRIPYIALQNVHRIRYKVSHFGIPNLANSAYVGCDVELPLVAPYDTYIHRFWYRDANREDQTIERGQVGIIERFFAAHNCWEWKIKENGTKSCVRHGRLLEQFTFDDFCFPAECYIDGKYPCTGKAGTTADRKYYSVTYVPGAEESKQVFLHNMFIPGYSNRFK